MLIAGALVAVLAFNAQSAQACARPTGSTVAKASMELAAKVGARDTTAVVRVCIATKDPAVRIGSYHGLVTWDSTAARLEKVEKGRMGMRIENTTKAGVVDFAGAFPAGLTDTIALTLRLSLTKPGKLPPLRLHMFELNEVTGKILTSQLRVTGYPSSLRTTPGPLTRDTAVRVASAPVRADTVKKSTGGGSGSTKVSASSAPKIISVTQTASGPGDPPQALIRGTGFTASGNTVVFGGAEIGNLPSADGGTMIRFTVPDEVPSSGEVPPMKISGGVHDVMVKNARGSSNVVKFELKSQL